jgi:hypothetical protein
VIFLGLVDGIYALITRGIASAAATFLFCLVLGLICLVKTANPTGKKMTDK